MRVTEHIHALRIPFTIPITVDKAIDRVVYAYLVFGEEITLIDSGVAGAGSLISDYIVKNGREQSEISRLILSHSHPDHVGAAKTITQATGCAVTAHRAEKHWIEDTERQMNERPVPGFQSLVEGPVAVDRLLDGGETLQLAKDFPCHVIHTPGHSAGSISLWFEQEKTLVSGDALPLPNDLPIYDDIAVCVASINKLKNIDHVETLLSSWEAPLQGREQIRQRIEGSKAYLERIHALVLAASSSGELDYMALCRQVVAQLGLPPFAANPLVAKALASSLAVEKGRKLFDEVPQGGTFAV